jgi:hypothetical protein
LVALTIRGSLESILDAAINPQSAIVLTLTERIVSHCIMRNVGVTCSQANRTVAVQDRLDCFLHGCPCGYYGDPRRACSCAPAAIGRYHERHPVAGVLREAACEDAPGRTRADDDSVEPPIACHSIPFLCAYEPARNRCRDSPVLGCHVCRGFCGPL